MSRPRCLHVVSLCSYGCQFLHPLNGLSKAFLPRPSRMEMHWQATAQLIDVDSQGRPASRAAACTSRKAFPTPCSPPALHHHDIRPSWTSSRQSELSLLIEQVCQLIMCLLLLCQSIARHCSPQFELDAPYKDGLPSSFGADSRPASSTPKSSPTHSLIRTLVQDCDTSAAAVPAVGAATPCIRRAAAVEKRGVFLDFGIFS